MPVIFSTYDAGSKRAVKGVAYADYYRDWLIHVIGNPTKCRNILYCVVLWIAQIVLRTCGSCLPFIWCCAANSKRLVSILINNKSACIMYCFKHTYLYCILIGMILQSIHSTGKGKLQNVFHAYKNSRSGTLLLLWLWGLCRLF